MDRDIWLIGIGTGNPMHITREGVAALQAASVVLMPHKGSEKGDLGAVRVQVLQDARASAQVVPFDYPERDPALPYLDRVARWHDEIAARWARALATAPPGPVALLVWGDPGLYDSTMRIAARLVPSERVRVFPGVTALQVLTAAHGIPFNSLGGAVQVTTGRRLRDHGWPDGVDTLAVMLDGDCSFTAIDPAGVDIWWGAYLGMPAQILMSGVLTDVSARIVERRAAARAAHGWIMDCYLLRRAAQAPL